MGDTYLGQNFLKDKRYITFIKEKLQNIKQKENLDTILEIGPGKGYLTKDLVSTFENIYLFEKDTSFEDILKSIVPVDNIQFMDVLELEIDKFLEKENINIDRTFLVGNLPYYITSPILKKFFLEFNKFKGGVFMVQKEVGEKIKTTAGKKSYLWWLLNFYYDISYLKTVPAKAFSPAPKVASCLIQFQKKENLPEIEFDKFKIFVEEVSTYKRKTLGKIFSLLKKKYNQKESQGLLIDNYYFYLPENLKQKRLEELSWENLGNILK